MAPLDRWLLIAAVAAVIVAVVVGYVAFMDEVLRG